MKGEQGTHRLHSQKHITVLIESHSRWLLKNFDDGVGAPNIVTFTTANEKLWIYGYFRSQTCLADIMPCPVVLQFLVFNSF